MGRVKKWISELGKAFRKALTRGVERMTSPIPFNRMRRIRLGRAGETGLTPTSLQVLTKWLKPFQNLELKIQNSKLDFSYFTAVSQSNLSGVWPLMMSKKAFWIFSVTGPRLPSPMTILSMRETGTISAAVPEKNTSSAI